MSEVLSLALRPKTFGEMVGQSKLTTAIEAHYRSSREPRAWMLVGDTGSGKTTMARIMAISLNCSHQEIFGHPCDECYENRSDFNIVEVPAAEVTGIDAIGAIVQASNYAPIPPSKRRVYILDEAQQLSNSAQNLLLKYFEDSPKTTVWIVCTTEPQKIIRTLRGRCLVYPLEPLTMKGTEKLINIAVKVAGLKRPVNDLLLQLYLQKIRSPRLILMALEKYEAGLSAEKSVTSGEATVDTLRICKALVNGDWESIKSEMTSADLNDARVVRLALAGYLKTIMLTSSGEKARHSSDGIEMLAQASRTEEGIQLSYTLAIMFRIARTFAGGSK